MRKGLFATLILGLILVLAACGGNNNDNNNAPADNNNDNNAAGGSSDIEITATNFEFDQDEYTVQAGDEVNLSLINEDGHHGIGIDEFDVNIEGEGDATFTADEPGEYTIYCSVPCGQGHDDMKSTLIVE